MSGFGKIDRGVSGRIEDAVVRGVKGTASVSGTEIRSALALPDDRVWINADKNVVGAIRSKYDDLMCEPGLPTSIAKSLPGGARQTFQSGAIYRNAGIDLAVWLKGPLYEEYLVAGGAPGVLGLPVADPVSLGKHGGASCPDGCSRADFEHGRIYWKGGIGAFALWGQRARVLQRPGWRGRRARVPDVAGADAGRWVRLGDVRARDDHVRERRELPDVLNGCRTGASSPRPGCPQARCSCTGTRR